MPQNATQCNECHTLPSLKVPFANALKMLFTLSHLTRFSLQVRPRPLIRQRRDLEPSRIHFGRAS
jgi:hypothetical protein